MLIIPADLLAAIVPFFRVFICKSIKDKPSKQELLKMLLQEFHYELPEHLIAQYPLERRTDSRLLCLNAATGSVEHCVFSEIIEYLQPEDLLIFNDTRVIPARLYGEKDTGGKVEILIERTLSNNLIVAQVRASKSPKPGTILHFRAQTSGKESKQRTLKAQVTGKQGDFFVLEFLSQSKFSETLAEYGHVPLPPYIKRPDEPLDGERYQTVYASHEGAVAAPTAGLHFDQELLKAINSKGIEQAFLTLHVAAATFQPVRVGNVLEHKMHKEAMEVNEQVCKKVNDCKARGGRVIAIGTTTVRSLESAASGGKLNPFRGDTNIFIYPGFEFQIVDAMVTNFHLPESTLLMLVSAFTDKEILLGAYHEAIAKNYRFFSYGDAMFIYKS